MGLGREAVWIGGGAGVGAGKEGKGMEGEVGREKVRRGGQFREEGKALKKKENKGGQGRGIGVIAWRRVGDK